MIDASAREWSCWAENSEGGAWWFAEVDSTQEAIKKEWVALQRPPSWGLCVAEAQTAGRGRHGHVWLSAAGQGLWFSLIVPTHRTQADSMPPVALLAADAIREALVSDGLAVGIKWPNDLWRDEAKVGGVLVESWRHQGLAYWIVGVGLNWRTPFAMNVIDKVGVPTVARGLWDEAEPSPGCRIALARRIIQALRAVMQSPDGWHERLDALQENHWLWQRRISAWVHGEKIAEGRAGALTPRGELTLVTDAGDSLIIGGSASVRVMP